MSLPAIPRGNRFVDANGMVTEAFDSWLREVARTIDNMTAWKTWSQSLVTFSSESGTFSVPTNGYRLYKYKLAGTVMRVAFNFQSATLSGCGVELRFSLPHEASATASTNKEFTGVVMITGVNGPDSGFVVTGSLTTAGVLRVFKPDFSAWTDDAGTAGIRGEIEFEVRP
jgi:hypothetical protein